MNKKCDCKEKIRYIDKEGLMYLLELVHKGVEKQIVDSIFEGALSDGKLEQRIEELAAENLIITQAELDSLARQINAATDEKLNKLKETLEPKIVNNAVDASLEAVDSKLNDELAEIIDSALEGSEIKDKIVEDTLSEASDLFVSKSGDTMSGALNAPQVTAGRFVTASGIIFY